MSYDIEAEIKAIKERLDRIEHYIDNTNAAWEHLVTRLKAMKERHK